MCLTPGHPHNCSCFKWSNSDDYDRRRMVISNEDSSGSAFTSFSGQVNNAHSFNSDQPRTVVLVGVGMVLLAVPTHETLVEITISGLVDRRPKGETLRNTGTSSHAISVPIPITDVTGRFYHEFESPVVIGKATRSSLSQPFNISFSWGGETATSTSSGPRSVALFFEIV